jgi:hypothetical protein
MKKLFVVIFILAFWAGEAWSKKVEPDVVKKVALYAFNQKIKNQSKSSDQIEKLLPKTLGLDTLFYIVNFDKSFVIVSAENSTPPILGYCSGNTYDESNIPPALKYLLNCYAKEIVELKKQNVKPTKEIERKWNEAVEGVQLKSGTIVVNPLISTSWGQGFPYNTYCPSNCYAGCVAVAMAQVINYWECRVKGTGQHSYQSDFGTETANFETANYQSDSALLVYHCGVSVNMDYGTDGSSASDGDVPNALVSYFGFKSQAERMWRIWHPFDWKSILRANLDYGWPIMYGGQDDALSPPEEAHEWVIDGYDTDDNFHCNWGWNGSYDGMFSIGGFNPNGSDYNEYQCAITYVEPIRTTGVETPQLASQQSFVYNPNGYSLTIPDADGATSYEWATNHGTIIGNGISVTLQTDCSATVQVRAYNDQCNLYSSYDTELITIGYGFSGPSTVCPSGSTFTVNNVPAGCTVNWGKSDNISVSSTTGNPKVFTASGTGTGWVQATIISTTCGSVTLPRKDVWVGSYSSGNYPITGPSSAPCRQYVYYSIPTLAGVTSINWIWPSGWTYVSGQNTPNLALQTGTTGSGGTVAVQATNSCGPSGSYATKYTTVTGICGYSLLVSPNPSNDVATVELLSTEPETQASLVEWELEVYDQLQVQKIKTPKQKGKTYQLNTQGWKDGVYIILAKVGDEIISEKLVVKH